MPNLYLIYQMGKVGSSTIRKSIEALDLEVYNAHFLSDVGINKRKKMNPHRYAKPIEKAENIIRIVKTTAKRIKIITVVREPIAREISNLFENWKWELDDIEKASIETLSDFLKERHPSWVLKWFDTEFKNYTNINIYDFPFDPMKGYAIYTFEEFDLLLIRQESLSKLGKAFKEFVGINLCIINANETKNKIGADKYRHLKKKLKIEHSELLKIYSSEYMQHFYSNQEIQSFINKWSTTITDL